MPSWAATAMLLFIAALFLATNAEDTKIEMPEGVIPQADSYVCTFVPLDPDNEHYITGFQPQVEKGLAHHILLFGCEEPGSYDEVWDCGEMTSSFDQMDRAPTCKSKPAILYAWAKEAPELKLPKDVGFKVGGSSGVNFLVMQVHYMHAKDVEDRTGLVLSHTETPQPKLAATMLLVTGGELQPKAKESFETACVIEEDVVMHPFAYRTHTHRHGKDVSGWIVNEMDRLPAANNSPPLVLLRYQHPNFTLLKDNKGEDHWTLIGRRDPQLPQMFVEVQNKSMVIQGGDMVSARCIMDNTEDRVVSMGSTGDDEMCNFYIMYWTDGEVMRDNTCFSPGAPLYYWGSEARLNHIPK